MREFVEEQVDSAAVDLVPDTHCNLDLGHGEYRTELGAHRVQGLVLTLHIGTVVGWRLRDLVVHTLLGEADSLGLGDRVTG
jgi:hypothetical protein